MQIFPTHFKEFGILDLTSAQLRQLAQLVPLPRELKLLDLADADLHIEIEDYLQSKYSGLKQVRAWYELFQVRPTLVIHACKCGLYPFLQTNVTDDLFPYHLMHCNLHASGFTIHEVARNWRDLVEQNLL